MAKLTDGQRKQIIADYIECGNYRETARKHGVSDGTVRNLVKTEKNIVQLCAQKKEENTENILRYMDGKTASIQRFADYLLDDRLNPAENKAELEKVSIPQLATVFGIMVDKALKANEISKERCLPADADAEEDGLFQSIAEGVKRIEI